MKEKKEKKSLPLKTLIISSSILLSATIVGSSYYLLQNKLNINEIGKKIFESSETLDDLNINIFLAAESSEPYGISKKPSEIVNEDKKYLRSFLKWKIDPNYEIDNFLENYEIDIFSNGYYNDKDGTLGVRFKAISRFDSDDVQIKDFIVGGFLSEKAFNIRFKNRIVDNLLDLEITNNKDIQDITKITSENFWNYFNSSNLLEKFEKKNDQIILKVNNYYKLKINPLTSALSLNVNQKTILPIEINLVHDGYLNYSKGIIKNIVLNNYDLSKNNYFIKEPSWNQLKIKEKYQDILPSIIEKDSKNILKYFEIPEDIDIENFDLEILSSSLDDQNGKLNILITNKITRESKIFNFVLNSYNKISDNIFKLTGIKEDYINKTYNISKGQKEALDGLKGPNNILKYETIGKQIKSYFSKEKLFKNWDDIDSNILDNYIYFDIDDIKIEDEGNPFKIKFVFKNSQQDQYYMWMDLDPDKRDDSNNIAMDFGNKSFSSEEILEDIKKRTLSIHYTISDDNSNNSKVISGTAWVFDRLLDKTGKGTNTYYLATNLHVVEEFIKNKEKVSSFSYSIKTDLNNLPHLDTGVNEEGNTYREVFRRMDRKINKFNSSFITKESEEFWKNLEIIPLGLNTPGKQEFSDFALIKVTFPEDKINKSWPFDNILDISPKTYQNIPDAVKYYNENKPNFFISNKIKWVNKEDKNIYHLPMSLNVGGYLGGKKWIKFSQIPYLSYDNNLKRYVNINDETYTSRLSTINLPKIRSGHGMSGSMVVNNYGQIVGIFWGGLFNEDKSDNPLISGIGEIDTLGIKIGDNKTLLSKWLDQTQNINTDLDKKAQEIKKYEQKSQTN